MDTHVNYTDLATSADVWRTMRKIAGESSRNGKIEILENARDTHNSLFRWVLKMVFDSTVVFGIKIRRDEWMPYMKAGGKPFNTEVSHFLTVLETGAMTRANALYKFQSLAQDLDVDSLSLLVAIINKDLDAGINTSTVNKVFKGLIPTFPYMRCSLPTRVSLEELEWKVGVYAQEKADGMFVNICVSVNGDVVLLSRQGTEIPTDKLGKEFAYLKFVVPHGVQIHGEMLIVNPDGRVAPREEGNGIINSICKGGSMPEGWSPLFRVWDCIPLSAVVSKGSYSEPYSMRFASLSINIQKGLLKLAKEKGVKTTCIELITTRIVYSLKEAKAFYKFMLSCGKEGAILKNPTAIWRDGTSKEQIKMKLECDCDLIVVGFEEGEGKYQGMLGALVCESRDGLLRTSVSGFSDKLRKTIWDDRDEYLGKIITVRFNDVMQKAETASLFLPRFVEFRNDKEQADTLSRIIDTQQQAIATA